MGRRGLEDAIDQVEEAALTTDSDQDDVGGHSIAQNDARRRSRAQLLAGLNSDAPSSEDDASRVAWSGDEGDDDVVQRHLQKAQKAKDKAAAKAAPKTSTKRKSSEAPKVKRTRKPTTGVGKIAAKPKKPATLRNESTYGDNSSDDDEDALDDSLPDYLKARKRTRDTEQAMHGNRGLKLPPNYDDVDFSDDERLADLSERPNFTQIQPCAPYEDIKMERSLGVIPAPIAQWLREYQVQGAEFMHEHIVYQKGGLLGDDMGLGKTIQVISALTAAFGKTGDERDAKRMRKMRKHPDKPWYPVVLIICPGSLMSNWHSELTRWGWWQVQFFHGSSEDKRAALRAALSGRVEIVITTYGTYLQNKSEVNLVKWDIVIADECHQIKNRKAEITKAMGELNSLCRIGLTGTAIQNKYDELWTLLNWTNPGQFGTLSAWKQHISKPLKTGQSHEATVPQLRLARVTARKLVNNLLPPFFLRRMKSLIAHQLPKKSDRVVFCPLTSDQQEAYASFIATEMVDTIQRAGDDCDCGRPRRKRGWCCYKLLSNGDKWQIHVFPAMMTLQKLSNHLALLIPRSEDSPDQQQKDLEKLEMATPDLWKDLYNTRDNIVHYANVNFCGKWKILRRLLDFWHKNGDKVLIFSHSVRLLKMLQMLFQSTTTFNVSYLDGSLSYADRTIAVDDFNADPGQFVFLISTKAGGVGLNITSANKVVIVDPNWNPAYDLQAQDRAFRIGQTRDVEVFRLVSAGTIEEIVYARQIYKQQQANIAYNASTERRYFAGVQENSDKKGEIFGLKNIFSYQGEGIILQDIVNKTNVAESRAGVNVIGLDTNSLNEEDDPLRASVDDADDPDSAMSQLAALVSSKAGEIDESTKRSSSARAGADAVAAILASAGVEYTHENSEVIGSSKIEAQLSRRAEEAGDDLERLQERVFAESQFEALSSAVESEDDDDDNLDGGNVYGGGGEAGSATKRRKFKPRYHPPEDVRSRQFCSMARHFGFEVREFALMVEGWTQAQRRACLERFYRERRERVVRS